MLYTVGTAAPVLSNALATPAVTRVLGPSAYGTIAAALVVIQVGMILVALGLGAAITRHGILESSGTPGARALVVRGAVIATSLCLLAALCAPLLAGRTPVGTATDLALTFAAALGFAIVVQVQALLRVLDAPREFVLLSLLSALGGPVAGLALLLGWEATPTAYLLGLVLGYAVAGGLGLVLTVRGGPVHAEPGDLGRALRVGLPTVPHQVALFLASGVLVLIAAAAYGSTAAGRLQLAVLIGSAPGVLTSSLNNAWAPTIYRTAQESRAIVLEHTSRDIAWLTACAAAWVAVAAPFLLRAVAPSTYDPTALTPAVGVVAVGTILSVPYLASVHLVFASGRSTGLAVLTPVSLAVGAAAASLAARSDLTLVSVGMSITYAVLALLTFGLARRVSPTRWRARVLVLPLLLGGLGCLAGALAPVSGGWLWARVAGAVLLLAAAALILLRALRR